MKDERNESNDTYEHWTQVIDGAPYGCWYRLRDDGAVEVRARGHHVCVPIEAVPLLPEAIARAVLANLAEGKTEAVVEAYQSTQIEDPPADPVFIDLGEASSQNSSASH